MGSIVHTSITAASLAYTLLCTSCFAYNYYDDNPQNYGRGGLYDNGASQYNEAAETPPTCAGKAYLSTAYGARNNRVTTLAWLDFARDFYQWNPRNRNSQWHWYGTGTNHTADNGLFVVHQQNGGGGSNGETRNTYNDPWQNDVSGSGYVDLKTLPFHTYFDNNSPDADYSYYEALVENANTPFTALGSTQRFLARMKFACKVFNADQHPFPASLVAKPYDDPRLLNCHFGVNASPNSSAFTGVYVTVTNNGVWANYFTQSFVSKRRIGYRPRYDSIVDAAIEYDNRLGVINVYLNECKVWTVDSIGTLPPDDGVNSINRGQNISTTPVSTLGFITSVNFGTSKCLDEADPNNPSSTLRLVRVGNEDTFYPANTNGAFYDNAGLRSNQLWGQGAVMKLYDLHVVRAESVASPVQKPTYATEQPIRLATAPLSYTSDYQASDQNAYDEVEQPSASENLYNANQAQYY